MSFVWDREVLKGHSYIDGVLTGEQPASADNGYGYDLVSSNHVVYDIGLKRDTNGLFHGYLRDLMIIKRPLAAYEVQNIYSGKSRVHLQEERQSCVHSHLPMTQFLNSENVICRPMQIEKFSCDYPSVYQSSVIMSTCSRNLGCGQLWIGLMHRGKIGFR